MPNSLDTREFIRGYLLEADEHVRTANKLLLEADAFLERGEMPHRGIRELFRALHTLKGLSAMVGAEPIVEISHEMEAILRQADQQPSSLTRPGVELLLKGVEAIAQRLRAFEDGETIPAAPRALVEALRTLQLARDARPHAASASVTLAPELLAKLGASEIQQVVDAVRTGRRAVQLAFAPSPERSRAGITITSVRERLGELAEIVKVIPQSVPASEAAPSGLQFVLLLLSARDDAALASAAGVGEDALAPIEIISPPAAPEDAYEAAGAPSLSSGAIQHGSIRVDVARLDDALEKLGGLIVTRFRMARQVALLGEQGCDVRELSAIMHEQGQQIRHLRAAITRARMVPVAQLLERVPLLVRGLSRSTGKEVKLHIDAGGAELDKAVAEQVFPAIIHLVRNAIDHAIEPADERRRLGKPQAGSVTVRCFALSDTHLEISVADDGAGIDRARVAARARRELPRDDRELLELITTPGLSTQEVATEHSGRGMGMDIVKRITLEQLGGELSLQTAAGRGTTFTLRVPLSISILDSFAFRCGTQRFVVPLAMVEEVLELEASKVFGSPAPAQTDSQTRMLLSRGEAIPLFDLGGLFKLPRATALGNALVVRAQGERFAISVDRMLGQQEVVVRPLEDPLIKMPGVAGTTDLGDGVPTLVLDVLGIGQLAATVSGEHRP
jgi:two-component system chemotaxis sensor kinase CheA